MLKHSLIHLLIVLLFFTIGNERESLKDNHTRYAKNRISYAQRIVLRQEKPRLIKKMREIISAKESSYIHSNLSKCSN